MGVIGHEQKLCPYYKECQEFQKLVELNDTGLVVYCYRPCTEDIRQGEVLESAGNISEDVFILHNKKDVKITTSELRTELEKENISCPRCRKIFEHAQELMKEVKSIDGKNVMGICDHCRKKTRGSKQPFCACDQIAKKFISVKVEQIEDSQKYVKTLPSKSGHLLKDTMLNKQKQKKTRSYPDLQSIPEVTAPASRQKPEIVQMFDPNMPKSNISLTSEMGETYFKKGHMEQDAAVVQPIEPMGISFTHPPHERVNINTTVPDASLASLDTAFVDTYDGVKEHPRPSLKVRKEDIFEDSPSMDAIEALKRRHDLSLRQMMRDDKDSGVSYSVSKGADIYEIPKTTSKSHVESEIDLKILAKHDLGPRGSHDLEYAWGREVKFKESKSFRKKSLKIAGKKYSKEGSKKVKKPDDRYIKDEELKAKPSAAKLSQKTETPDVADLKSGPIKATGLKSRFSFVFPKGNEEKKPQSKLNEMSSYLIKDTKDKFRLQAEEEEKRKEEEHQRKLEQEQKRKLAREEKKQQAEENKRQAIEDQKKYEEEQNRLAKKDLKSKNILDSELKDKQKQTPAKTKHIEIADDVSKKHKVDNDEVTKTEEKDTEKPQLKSSDDDQTSDDRKTNDQKSNDLISAMKKQIGKSKDKDLKSGPEQKEKDAAYKKKMKEMEQLIKKDLKKVSKEKAAASKTGKSTKKTGDSSVEMKESSLSKIQKSMKTDIKQTPGKKQDKESALTPIDTSEFQKLRAELAEQKAEARKKKQLELEAKKAALKKKKELIKLKNIRTIKSGDNLDISRLYRIKQAAKMRACDVKPHVIQCHIHHHMPATTSDKCPLCLNSELEFEVLAMNRNHVHDTDIVIGEKIFKCKTRPEKTKKPEVVPILFRTDFGEESDQQPKETLQIPQETTPARKHVLTGQSVKDLATEPDKRGILHYALSDRTFIDNGWTMLPTEKVVQKLNVYRMRPAHPEFDWFKHNKNKRLMTYDSGERLAEFDDNGRGRWYYKNGRLALDYYDAEEKNVQQRFVIYSSGEPDERGRTHPITILATFDYLGNGIVFDHAGKIRLKYNQTEGVVLDRGMGPVTHWKWHSLNDPPVLQQVMIDTQMAHKDPHILTLGSNTEKTTRPDNEEMLAIEFDNFLKEKSKKLSQKFIPFQIKMKALKINEHFSLKVLDQSTVYLIYRDGSTNLKLNIGMILDHKEIVDIDATEVGEVPNSLERFPARTDSLADLQRSVAHAQRYERQHIERDRRLRPTVSRPSVDQMTAAVSPPLRLPLRTVPTGSSSSTGCCSRKPANNLYYDTRFLC